MKTIRRVKTLNFRTSVYSAAEMHGKMFVGGSDWDRRKTLYSEKVAKESKGILHIMNQKGNKENKVYLPSMIYSLIPLPENKLFLGCKSQEKTLNIVDKNGKILLYKNDNVGRGVYQVENDKNKKELLVATREGFLEIFDYKLKLKNKIRLSERGVRLWSVKKDFKEGNIYCGDYKGNLFVLKRNPLQLIKKIDLKNYYKEDPRLNKGFGPSLWGIELMEDYLVLGHRWGDLIFLDKKSFRIKKRINLGKDISTLRKFSDNMAIGTRQGYLYFFSLEKEEIIKTVQVKPSLQKENAVWGLDVNNNKLFSSFSDGKVVIFE